MKKSQITIDYNGRVYKSSAKEIITDAEKAIKMAVKGELSYLNFDSEADGQTLYFPKNILVNSIISITYLD